MTNATSTAHERLRALWLARAEVRDTGLVAFAVPRARARCEPEELRAWLAARLPGHMVPARFVVIEQPPRTPGGKIDRHALRVPDEEPRTKRTPVPPRTHTEQRVAALFAQVLGVHPESMDDDFFADLSGHSLVATRLASLIRSEWPIEFELRSVFEHPTVAGLAACIDEARQRHAGTVSIPRRSAPHAADR